LGIYKLNFVRAARYVGISPDGSEICEHVAFNEEAVRAGGVLYIFPKLLNRAPPEHLQQRLFGVRRLAADLDLRSYKFYPTVSPVLGRLKRILAGKAAVN
jgi:hypothetical protein